MSVNASKHSIPCRRRNGNRPAMALLITIVILVVLTTVVYTTTSKMALIKHRQQYLIDYQKARYACDSAMKYALEEVKKMKIAYIDRRHQPDFSDMFTTDQYELEDYILEWLESESKLPEEDEDQSDLGTGTKYKEWSQPYLVLQDNKYNSFDNELGDPYDDESDYADERDSGYDNEEDFYIDPNEIVVPGPYGPPWPEVIEPEYFDIGGAKVVMTVEDENAKMPATWAITTDSKVKRAASDAVENFCEWMQMDRESIEQLQEDLINIAKVKNFYPNMGDIVTSKTVPSISSRPTTRPSTSSSRRRVTSRRTTSASRSRVVKTTRPKSAHALDFARLLQSSTIDLDTLALAIPDTGDRYESALKYFAIWGSQKVNINTAPRHVLEAAFMFGGDAEDIANEIIQIRKKEPIASTDKLEGDLYAYGESIRKCLPYITTTSTFFTIKVTATSGKAKATLVALIKKDAKNTNKIAVVSDL